MKASEVATILFDEMFRFSLLISWNFCCYLIDRYDKTPTYMSGKCALYTSVVNLHVENINSVAKLRPSFDRVDVYLRNMPVI